MLKSYASRSNAIRALKNFSMEAVKHASELIEINDGEYEFDTETVEKFLANQAFPDETIALEAEEELAAALDAEETVEEFHQVTEQQHAEHRGETKITREAQKTSMKLDRTIICVETAQVWKNAHQMWKENPTWMTSAQEDALTRKLYVAAKVGKLETVVINGRSFQLVNGVK